VKYRAIVVCTGCSQVGHRWGRSSEVWRTSRSRRGVSRLYSPAQRSVVWHTSSFQSFGVSIGTSFRA